MYSTECLRQLVRDKLSIYAEEIFTIFHDAIVEYDKELDRHRQLLDLAWKPVVKLHRIGTNTIFKMLL